MKRPLLSIIVTLSLLVLTSCGAFALPTDKTLYLESYQTECVGMSLRLCLLEKETSNGEWQYRYSGIEGFEYEWGYTYTLRVRERQRQNPMADQSSIETTLLEVLSKEKVPPDVPFQLRLTTRLGSDPYIIQKTADLFEFHGAKEFTCSEEVCTRLGNLLDEDLWITVEFTHPERAGDPLIARRIVSTEPLPEGY